MEKCRWMWDLHLILNIFIEGWERIFCLKPYLGKPTVRNFREGTGNILKRDWVNTSASVWKRFQTFSNAPVFYSVIFVTCGKWKKPTTSIAFRQNIDILFSIMNYDWTVLNLVFTKDWIFNALIVMMLFYVYILMKRYTRFPKEAIALWGIFCACLRIIFTGSGITHIMKSIFYWPVSARRLKNGFGTCFLLCQAGNTVNNFLGFFVGLDFCKYSMNAKYLARK